MKLLRSWVKKYPDHSQRVLEILPGFVSWSLILFPVWGSFLLPVLTAYYVIAFDVYWFYRSVSMAILSLMAHYRIKASEIYDWAADAKKLTDWQKVKHVLVIPTYKEPVHTLERTLETLSEQTIGPKQIIPVIALEERAGEEHNEEVMKVLKKRFSKVFEDLIFSVHPRNLPGEVIGKSANAAWASKVLKARVVERKDWDMDFMTISSVDCDVVLHKSHLAALTFKFLQSPIRYNLIWQGAIVFYNNIEKIPLMMKIFNRVSSVIYMGLLMRPDRLINFSTYSMSLKLMDEVGYWDADVIPEDYRIFFKTYFAKAGQLEVEPIFLPVYADAAESIGYVSTFNNTYQQVKRWAWGASDDAYIMKKYITDTQAPFIDKTLRVFKVLEDHFLWPVNWFVITLGATLPPLLNEEFARTIIGKTLPQVASAILTASLLSMVLIIFVDFRARPEGRSQSPAKKIWSLLEFALLPVVGLFFAALPGLEAHTRLMIGKYIEYRVTEKV
jgi:cellulose synthase/poly-beta-1,6-N-acetylglucosamine synthase-like glycosyltransferase